MTHRRESTRTSRLQEFSTSPSCLCPPTPQMRSSLLTPPQDHPSHRSRLRDSKRLYPRTNLCQSQRESQRNRSLTMPLQAMRRQSQERCLNLRLWNFTMLSSNLEPIGIKLPPTLTVKRVSPSKGAEPSLQPRVSSSRSGWREVWRCLMPRVTKAWWKSCEQSCLWIALFSLTVRYDLKVF